MAIGIGLAARTLLAALLWAALLVAGAPAAGDEGFLREALAACGTDDACEAAQWQAVYAELRGAILTDAVLQLPEADRLAAILRGLHEQILIGSYQPEASDLRLALARGDYNCLSATALYFDLCRAARIELEIWSRPGHVWLQTASGEVLEPASWQGGTPSLARRVSVGRQISPRELLGRFYYNRGVQLLAQRQYAEGLALIRKALELDPRDADARENLLAGINNWAAEHLRARRFREAARLIRQGLAIEPAYGPLVANQRLLP